MCTSIKRDLCCICSPMIMGCYGIGVTRLLASAIEVLSTSDNHLRWPTVLAPYQICIIPQVVSIGLGLKLHTTSGE